MRRKRNLEKAYTREHSLFYCMAWSESDRFSKGWGDAGSLSLFIGEGASKKISVWYDQRELDEYYEAFAKRFRDEPGRFSSMREDFRAYWAEWLDLIRGTKRIETVDDLEHMYHLYIRWWTITSDFYCVPELPGAPASSKRDAMKIREETQEYTEFGDDAFRSFIASKFPEYSRLAYVMAPQEAFLLKYRRLRPREVSEIESRLGGYAIIDSQIYPKAGLKRLAREYDFELKPVTAARKGAIKGSPASKGRATGRVRLLLFKDQLPRFKEGEVLVTEMTSPDFVPAMKKAAAIVTDEGGITCHAAIASRELGKPCVIGTKTATQILKDGDLVEVDADGGVVRVMSWTSL
ncbi:MAG: hypothetical protein KGI69_01805 [Patescibacteria group bacterium]|nr:hypothetical protein [Patescibacteria group bacterium]